jgi:nucleoside triphosphate pyrophosphatase
VELILASGSPRRTEFLREWGFAHRVLPADIPEPLDLAEEPRALARELASRKAAAVAAQLTSQDPESVVLAADTVVSVEGLHLGKAGSAAEATQMLLRLAGRELEVATGVAVVHVKAGLIQVQLDEAVATRLRMRKLDDDEIAAYVATGEPLGKAGAFAIQGLGGALIEHREGSLSNVVGLPRRATLALLAACGMHPQG